MGHYALLSLIARIHPAAVDAIHPHGPLMRDRYSLVALNPQPLPPEPPPDRFLIEAALMARELTRLAIEADLRGEESTRVLSEVIDDWCGTPWPRKWPWPWPGPRPQEGPHPDPWRINTARIIGALVLADHASRLGEGDLSNALAQGAERLTEAALTEGQL